MKKIKPWAGQKEWEEKQAEIAKETTGGGITSPGAIQAISKAATKRMHQDLIDSMLYGIPKHNYRRVGSSIDVSVLPPGSIVNTRPGFIYGAYDGGEDGERDDQFSPWLPYTPDYFPKSEEKTCCKEEDRVNIGFMQDKWCCKVCGKDMK